MTKLFISGSFNGLAGSIRGLIKDIFESHGIEILMKNGSVQESVASLIDSAEGVIFILGAHSSVIEDVWGRKLVDLELSYAKNKNRPILPILISIDESENIPLNVIQLRKQINCEFMGKHIEISEIVDYLNKDKLKCEIESIDESKLNLIMQKIDSVCTLGWKRFARVFNNNKVFISHSSVDKPMAERIHDSLLRYELIPWFDKYKIYAGRDLAKQIERAIDASGFVIVLISKNSIESDWVKKEVYQALENEKKYADSTGNIIIPIILDNCKIPEELQFLLDRLYIKLSTDANIYEAGIRKLVSSIKDSTKIDHYLEG